MLAEATRAGRLSLPLDISKLKIPSPMEQLGGQFAIRTDLRGNYLTAVGGGGRITDVIHTDALTPRAWEEFRLWVDSVTHQYYAIQTATGNFITAVDAGGRTTDTIHSDATAISTWETFQLPRQSSLFDFAIQTFRGFFLTAVGGGGHASGDTIHTDALQALEWERFQIIRRLDFGTGSTYAIESRVDPKAFPPSTGGYLVAGDGGDQSGNGAFYLGTGAPFWLYWTLLKQDDGTYALQTASGRVLTANDGGLPGAGFRTDTPANAIGNFEKFTIDDNGEGSNFTARIKTYSGTYLTRPSDPSHPNIATVEDATKALDWQFDVVSF